MNSIFLLPRLLIKKKLNVLTPAEKSELKALKKDYPFLDKPDFEVISQKISNYESVDKDKAWNTILFKKQTKSRKVKLLSKQSFLKYAAVFLLFLGVGYMYHQSFLEENTSLIIPTESVTIQLENGHTEIIKEDGSSQILDTKGNIIGNQNGKELVYSATNSDQKLVYNTLYVPYGKRFEVQLSDGSKVHLNAGSSLKFPVHFLQNHNREVFLNGEAFFEVSKDKNHPFTVHAEGVNIRVLGTTFNMSSYIEDNKVETVLLEGSVGLYTKDSIFNAETATLLQPGFKAQLDKSDKNIEVSTANTEIHTAWMKGNLILNGVPFNDILRKLERQYNVVFVNNNKTLENRKFTAHFDTENIYQVMKSFSYSASFTYKFDANKIIINP